MIQKILPWNKRESMARCIHLWGVEIKDCKLFHLLLLEMQVQLYYDAYQGLFEIYWTQLNQWVSTQKLPVTILCAEDMKICCKEVNECTKPGYLQCVTCCKVFCMEHADHLEQILIDYRAVIENKVACIECHDHNLETSDEGYEGGEQDEVKEARPKMTQMLLRPRRPVLN